MAITPPSPFLGIHSFRFADRDRFFGRTREVEQLLAKLLSYHMVVLFGESGAGKSSLLNAGLVPGLLKERFQPERLRVGQDAVRPLTAERIAVDSAGSSYLPSIFDSLAGGAQEKLSIGIDTLAGAVRQSNELRPVLIVDQFEELFTRFADAGSGIPPVQAQVLNALVGLAEADGLAVKLLIVIREDYLAKLEPAARRSPQLLFNRVQLLPLGRPAARQAILQPFELAAAWRSRLEPALADRLIMDLARGSDWVSSTQLQIVCARLWDSFAGSRASIGEGEYKKLGGFDGIVNDYFQNELQKTDAAVRHAAILALGRMVTASGTRDVVSQENILQLVDVPEGDAKKALDFLEAQRLINRTLERNTIYCEIANEYLIPAIQKQVEAARIEAALAQSTAEIERQQRQALEGRAEARRTEAARRRATRFAYLGLFAALLAAGFAIEWYRTSAGARLIRNELEVSRRQLTKTELDLETQRSRLRETTAELEKFRRDSGKAAAGAQRSVAGRRGMFRVLDVMLGFAFFVLLASFAGMLITQAVSGFLLLKSKQLRRGLAELLRRLDPGMPESLAMHLGDTILRHESVAGEGNKPGAVIFRDQFTKLLLEMGAENKMDVRSLLQRNGISDPGNTLSQVEIYLSKLSVSYPELAESERQNLALLAAGQSRFITVLNEWFDRTMDRVSDRYRQKVQTWLFAISLLLAGVVQFDTFAILNRMSMDTETRAMVLQSPRLSSESGADLAELRSQAASSFFFAPATPKEWWRNLSHVNAVGLVLSAILLTVGAQFWYNALKNVLGLQSIAAAREAEQRTMRQTPGLPHGAPPMPDTSPLAQV